MLNYTCSNLYKRKLIYPTVRIISQLGEKSIEIPKIKVEIINHKKILRIVRK